MERKVIKLKTVKSDHSKIKVCKNIQRLYWKKTLYFAIENK